MHNTMKRNHIQSAINVACAAMTHQLCRHFKSQVCMWCWLVLVILECCQVVHSWVNPLPVTWVNK